MEKESAAKTPFGINTFGIATHLPASRALSAEDVKKAILATVEAIPEEKLRNLTKLQSGRLTILV